MSLVDRQSINFAPDLWQCGLGCAPVYLSSGSLYINSDLSWSRISPLGLWLSWFGMLALPPDTMGHSRSWSLRSLSQDLSSSSSKYSDIPLWPSLVWDSDQECLWIVTFIHSFILNIYIAQLQENYSEALPTPARLNKAVLRWEKKRRLSGSVKNAKFRREAVPGWGKHHGEGVDLLSGGMGKRDKKDIRRLYTVNQNLSQSKPQRLGLHAFNQS